MLRLSAATFLLSITAAAPAHAAGVAEAARHVLSEQCGPCHGASSSGEGGIDFIDDLARLKSSGLVAPGDAAHSTIIAKVQDSDPSFRMPLGLPPLSTAEIGALTTWINGGAVPDDEPTPTGPVITLERQLELALADIDQLSASDPAAAKRTRYLTLCHLKNNGAPAAAISRYANSVSQVLNSLSWQTRIARPAPLAAESCILRFDLAAYGLTAAGWEALIAAYPYGADDPDGSARRIALATGSAQGILRADWFIATATRPPHYHNLLGIPDNVDALAQSLHINLDDDLRSTRPHARRIWRAGFARSGVSNFNRAIDRHVTSFGALWRSYDFGSSGGAKNILNRPIGPQPVIGSLPQTGEDLGFAPDGGEIIWNLPNGLQAYMLVNGIGHRIDVGPANIVFHRQRGEPITNGISCMSCHLEGMIPKADEVLPYLKNANGAGLSSQALQIVDGLYADPTELADVVEQDRRRFVDALHQAELDPAAATNELLTLSDAYQTPLDLKAAAAELGLRDEADARNRLNRLTPTVRHTLAPLLTNLTLPRDAFEAVFSDAAAQLLAMSSTLTTSYSNAELRFSLAATSRALSFDIDDDGSTDDLQIELTLQGDTRCKISLRLQNPAGTATGLLVLPQTSPSAGEGLIAISTHRASDPLGNLLNLRSGGTWRLEAAAPDPCTGDRPVVRKLRFLATIH